MREELLIALVMLGVSAIGSILTKNDKKWSVVFLLIAALAGSLAAGMGIRFREMVEGPFGFLDVALSVCTAAVFVRILDRNGTFEALLDRVCSIKNKNVRALTVLLVIALPAMFTGLATSSVITTGALVGRRMKVQGVAQNKVAGAVVAGSFLGMMLPPNCLPAMIAANGAGSVLPTPYVGFFLPLLVLSLPCFVVYALMNRDVLALESVREEKMPGRGLIVLGLVSAAILVEGLLSSVVYIGGNTLIFTLGAIAGLILTCRKVGGAKSCLDAAADGVMDAVVPVAIMLAVGSFVEVSSMTGVRGLFSLYILPYSVTAVMLVLMAVSLVLGLGLSVPIPAFLATYAVFPIGWLANTVIVTGVSVALGLVYLITLRGGLKDSVCHELALDGVKWSDVMKNVLIPAVMMLVIGVVMVVLGDSMSFLIL